MKRSPKKNILHKNLSSTVWLPLLILTIIVILTAIVAYQNSTQSPSLSNETRAAERQNLLPNPSFEQWEIDKNNNRYEPVGWQFDFFPLLPHSDITKSNDAKDGKYSILFSQVKTPIQPGHQVGIYTSTSTLYDREKIYSKGNFQFSLWSKLAAVQNQKWLSLQIFKDILGDNLPATLTPIVDKMFILSNTWQKYSSEPISISETGDKVEYVIELSCNGCNIDQVSLRKIN